MYWGPLTQVLIQLNLLDNASIHPANYSLIFRPCEQYQTTSFFPGLHLP